ncbi:MAG: hypothetical protein IRY84_10000, partial [Thermobispora bispora]|nr:hypothetical protein [Thermobispora bispora]
MLTRWFTTAAENRRSGIPGEARPAVRRSRLSSAITAMALATGLTA